ncbi:MAG: hypothetical protein V3W31_09720 [Thermodesulfobacteriota bacterium]
MLRFLFIDIPRMIVGGVLLLIVNVVCFLPRLFYKLLIDYRTPLWINFKKSAADKNFMAWLDLQIKKGDKKIKVPKELAIDVSRKARREAMRLCKDRKIKLLMD